MLKNRFTRHVPRHWAMRLLVAAIILCGYGSSAMATENERLCRGKRFFGFCLGYFSQEEEAEVLTRAALEAEVSLREQVHYRNGVFIVDQGWFSSTKFPDGPDKVKVLCGGDDPAGMEIVFSDNRKKASVVIRMNDEVCDRIAQRLGETASHLALGE